jgi:hypothetical protein
MMSKQKKINEKAPKVVEELAQIIDRGLEQLSKSERNTRLGRIHSLFVAPRNRVAEMT